ncbi:MAG: hypothetical protein IKI31_04820 [Treponema sp.]|nr:hypothetical protein [Treponema sp.]
MISSKINLENTYTNALEDELRFLERRRSLDQNLTVEDLETTLEWLHVQDGDNFDGRGALQQTAMDAQIAAYEIFINDWKKEIAKNGEHK